MRKFFKLIYLLTILLLLTSCKSNLKEIKKNYLFFDTNVSITLYSNKNEEKIIRDIESTLALYDSICNRYKETSFDFNGIYEVNQSSNEEIIIPKELYDLIEYSINNENDYFKIGIGKISDIWHDIFSDSDINSCETPISSTLPPKELTDIKYEVDSSNIVLNKENSSIKLLNNISLDLGGIAKGYCQKLITDLLDKNDIKYIVNFGNSNIKTNYGNPNRKNNAFYVGLQNPNYKECNNENLIYARLNAPLNKTIVTSGDYQKYIIVENIRYSHILDPNTNYPVITDIRSITLVLDDGGLGDILSTTLFMMGKEKAIDYIENNPNIGGIIFDTENQIYVSDDLFELVDIVK